MWREPEGVSSFSFFGTGILFCFCFFAFAKSLHLSNDPCEKESANNNSRWNVTFFHCYN